MPREISHPGPTSERILEELMILHLSHTSANVSLVVIMTHIVDDTVAMLLMMMTIR